MKKQNFSEIRKTVQAYYADRAAGTTSCCDNHLTPSSCCTQDNSIKYNQEIGYTLEELQNLPESTMLGLGCGNPTADANIQPGETILDLGSGGGMDAFIAANAVGDEGRVIGVDMTPEMIELAQKNAARGGYSQVEFRLGLIESLPIEDETIDLVISNCVVNLSTDKKSVFEETFRVLKPGGRIAISDTVRVADLPENIHNHEDAYCGCVAGAASLEELETYLKEAGFQNIDIRPKGASEEVINGWDEENLAEAGLGKTILSMLIKAEKPT